MEPVSSIDRVVLILRKRLEERDRARSTAPSAKDLRRSGAHQAGGLAALAALGEVEDRALRRTFIQTLLVDQLGQGLINDSQFQQVIERVTETIEADPDAAALVTRLLSDLRSRGALPHPRS